MIPFLHRRTAVVLVCSGLILSGCHHAAASKGESAFEFIRAPARPGKGEFQPILTGSQPKDMHTPATPIPPLAQPIYPPAALAAHAGRVKVVLQFTIGVDGRVMNVSPSLAGIPYYGPFGAQFQAAAEAALAQWRFEPAEMRHLEPSDSDGTTIWTVTRSEKREMATQVAFTFTETGAAVIDRK